MIVKRVVPKGSALTRVGLSVRSFSSRGHLEGDTGPDRPPQSDDWKRLKPDPNRVPNTRPPSYKPPAAKNEFERLRLYDQEIPSNNISSVTADGFVLESGVRLKSTPEEPRALLVAGNEAFSVDVAWSVKGLQQGRVEFGPKIMGILEIMHPKPDMLVVGLGSRGRILGPETAQRLRELGLQTEVGATHTAASNFDMLASERGGRSVAGFLLPPNV